MGMESKLDTKTKDQVCRMSDAHRYLRLYCCSEENVFNLVTFCAFLSIRV